MAGKSLSYKCHYLRQETIECYITNPNPLPNPNSRLPITMEGHVYLIGELEILCF
jgi:hypothetical protein